MTLTRAYLLAGSAVGLLLGTGCGTADPNLFGSGSVSAGGSASAGTANSAGSSGMQLSIAGGGAPNAGADAGGSGGSGIGCSFSCGDAGRGGSSTAGMSGASDQAGSGSMPNECSALDADATYLPSTQHCYLVDSEQRTFAEAQAHCAELKAHLVTLGSVAEHQFAWSIHEDEHWIGAKDGKMPKQSGVGTYTWITDEAFDYTNWSSQQPNASKTECVEGGSNCYEHCAFQWKGGEQDGQWNDRYCMHTIASICEWDSVP